MNRSAEVVELHPMDVPAAHQLMLESFQPGLQPYMTATQSGSRRFLAAFVEAPHLHPDRRYLVVKNGEAVLAYAEFRRILDTTGFLSYICVASEARGQGLAGKLIDTYCSTERRLTELQLDVFTDNLPALSFYERRGFAELSRSAWWLKPLPQASRQETLRMLNWPHALASLERYGFCEHMLEIKGERFKVGQLGQTVRCMTTDDYENSEMLAALGAAFPDLREALYIGPQAVQNTKTKWTAPLKTSLRLALSLS